MLGVTCAEESFCEAILRLAGGDGARDSPSLWDDRPSQILIGPVAHPFSFARVTFIILLSAWVLVGAHGGLLCAVGAMFGVAVTSGREATTVVNDPSSRQLLSREAPP